MTVARVDHSAASTTARLASRPIVSIAGVRPVTEERIEQLSGMAVRLATEPALSFSRGVGELVSEADHDRELLGRSWMRVAVGARRRPSRAGATAERLLRAALEREAERRAAA